MGGYIKMEIAQADETAYQYSPGDGEAQRVARGAQLTLWYTEPPEVITHHHHSG